MTGEPEKRISRSVTPLSTKAIDVGAPLRFPLKADVASAVVRAALEEDGAFNDITTVATVHSTARARAKLVARQAGVIAGVPLAVEAFRILDPTIAIRTDIGDGTVAAAGAQVLYISGHARGMLAAERVALNFLQHLSGIASMTARFVDAVKGTSVQILDTRKTTPGWRRLEKYAVRAGGGKNHRSDLSAAVLIKDNHLAALGGDIAAAVSRARALAPADTKIEVECDRLEQVSAAIAAGADIVLLDNMTVDELRAAVALVDGRAITEASGGVRLDTVRTIADTGVDWISVGAITHSAGAMNLALDFE
jgi:nicotinate-nucleotide pyrophosphorylase (carboxylating)